MPPEMNALQSCAFVCKKVMHSFAPFSHPAIQCLLSTCDIPGIVMGVGYSALKKLRVTGEISGNK